MSDWGSLLNLEQVCFYEFCRYARLEVSFCEFLSGVVNTCCTHSYIYVYSYTNVLLFSCIYMQRIYDYLSIYLFIYLSIYPSFYSSIYLSIYISKIGDWRNTGDKIIIMSEKLTWGIGSSLDQNI